MSQIVGQNRYMYFALYNSYHIVPVKYTETYMYGPRHEKTSLLKFGPCLTTEDG